MVTANTDGLRVIYYPETKRLLVCISPTRGYLEYSDIPVDIFAALITDKDPPRYWYEFIANRHTGLTL